MAMPRAVTDRPVLSSIAAVAVSITATIGAANALKVRLIPWATADEVKTMIEEAQGSNAEVLMLLQRLSVKQEKIDKAQRIVLKAYWEQKLEEAADELELNPGSRTALKQKKDADRELALISNQEAADDADR